MSRNLTFDGTICKQVKGTPMGLPISGFIAEAVLQRLESLVFQHHKPKFWARYVDDTFVVIERDQVLTFQEHLNAVFPDIQFTMEEEENNQLAFLDALVCRKDCGGLKTKVFRKATNTMRALNFSSNHPISHKRSCVRTLYRRVETHCSEPEDKIAELQYLRRVFKASGCMRNFVNRCICKRDEWPNRTDTKSWRALPQCTRNKDPIPLLKTAEGEHLTEDRAKADHLSEIFRSVFSSETGFNPSVLQHFEDTTLMETVHFTEGMVLAELLRLKESKSPGPEEIPAKILKELANNPRIDQSGRRTTLVARELARHKVDTVALSEAWYSEHSQLEEDIKDRLMGPGLPSRRSYFTIIIGAYAPPMTGTDKTKTKFYEDLHVLLPSVPNVNKLIVLGDFNARIVTGHSAWRAVLDSHRIAD
ncbi:hypothetical protein SprV_0702357400 [Sparganum proliferum]